MRALALDYGSARCGVALSDPTGTIATPLAAVERPASKRGMASLAALVREREADVVVIGLPLALAGHDTDQTRETRAFADRLARRIAPVRVELHDERLTTRMAQRLGQGARADEDSRAAAHLLESYLASRSP